MRARIGGLALAVGLVVAGIGLAPAAPAGAAPFPPKQMVMRVYPVAPIYSQIVNLNVTTKRTPTGAPRGGTVTFYVDDVVVGSVSDVRQFVSSLKITTIGVGTHTTHTTYSGDATTAPGTSNVVTFTVAPAPTTTRLVAADDPVDSGSRAELRATVLAPAPATTSRRPTGSVVFRTGTRTATVALNANGVAVWRPVLADGPHEVTAEYLGSTNHTGSTTPEPVTVTVDDPV